MYTKQGIIMPGLICLHVTTSSQEAKTKDLKKKEQKSVSFAPGITESSASRRPLGVAVRLPIVGGNGEFIGRILAMRLQDDSDHSVMWELADILLVTRHSLSDFYQLLQYTLRPTGMSDAKIEQVLFDLSHKILSGRLLKGARMAKVSFTDVQRREVARHILEKISPDELLVRLSKGVGACEEVDELVFLLKENLVPHLQILKRKLLERLEPIEVYHILAGLLGTMEMSFTPSTPPVLNQQVSRERRFCLEQIEDERPEALAIREQLRGIIREAQALGPDGVPALSNSDFVTGLDRLPPYYRARLEEAMPSVFARLDRFRELHDAKAALERLHGKEVVDRLFVKELNARNDALSDPAQLELFDGLSRQAFMMSRLEEVIASLGHRDPVLLTVAIADVVEGMDDAGNADKIKRAMEKYQCHRDRIAEELGAGRSPQEILLGLKG